MPKQFNLREWREERGLTQKKLGELLEVTEKTIRRREAEGELNREQILALQRLGQYYQPKEKGQS